MTVKNALVEKRGELKDEVQNLVYCKRELFYILKDGTSKNSVYPVSWELAEKEAEFFGIKLYEA